MAILVRNIPLGLDEPDDSLNCKTARRLGLPSSAMQMCVPVRRSLDARDRDRICFVYNLEVRLQGGEREEKQIVRRLGRQDVAMVRPVDPPVLEPGPERLESRPVIVGFGPAGMFAGLLLAEHGYAPIILERGRDVRRRHADVMLHFYREGRFDPESNLLFGEGGAGTYSDGKLYTRVNDPRAGWLLKRFCEFGAPEGLLIDGRPHVGSEKLPGICRRIRMRIESAGGEVRFDSRVRDFVIRDGRLTHLRVGEEEMLAGPVLLGLGHSARDTYRQLAARGVKLEAKAFQMGIRIEHPQAMVNRWQYGQACGHERLPPADYHLVAKKAAGERGDCYSFCMCPGGMILPTNESPGLIATNGASKSNRGGPFANSGLVVTINPAEFGCDPLAGLDWVEQWERRAFEQTGKSYRVPAHRASDFLAGRLSDGTLETTYPLGGAWTDIAGVLPDFVTDAVRKALAMLDRRLPGYAGGQGIITGPETRASAPLRILRDPMTRQSVSTENLYPIGEGAGYAGGILSAAIDGLKTAEQIIARYRPLTR